MSSSAQIVPAIILSLSFLFVLLIILMVKTPKVGVWVVGGLILVAPLLLYRLARAGLSAQPDAAMLIVLPAAFLFVLLIILLTKAPKAGAGIIAALVVMGLCGALLVVRVSVPRAAQTATVYPPEQMGRDARQQTGSGAGSAVVHQEFERAFADSVSPPSRGARLPAPAPIWSAGIEAEMRADIYPSKLAAARAAGEPLGQSIRELAGDVNTPPRVVIFQEAHEYRLIAELRDAVRRALPEFACDVEAQNRPANANELIVALHLGELDARPAPWAGPREIPVQRGTGLVQYVPVESAETTAVASGQLDINLSGRTGRVHIPVRFTEKPWLEDFATFASTRPQRAFIIARSLRTCTSEGEAHQQALDDARARLTEAIRQRTQWITDRLPQPEITTTDVLQGGFVVDRFAQSFEGTVGKVWRQALLLDVSGPKLAQLAGQKAREFRQVKMTWARMGFSVIGVVVLIGVIYFFLNMATRGYYEWSLRIACVVLAVVGVLSILMVVH
ncbi:MAG: hypothetical protein FJ280_05545 [Planctomycetes bacterium]|nr:hypothetical protein [Planctomycetota bacterium]